MVLIQSCQKREVAEQFFFTNRNSLSAFIMSNKDVTKGDQLSLPYPRSVQDESLSLLNTDDRDENYVAQRASENASNGFVASSPRKSNEEPTEAKVVMCAQNQDKGIEPLSVVQTYQQDTEPKLPFTGASDASLSNFPSTERKEPFSSSSDRSVEMTADSACNEDDQNVSETINGLLPRRTSSGDIKVIINNYGKVGNIQVGDSNVIYVGQNDEFWRQIERLKHEVDDLKRSSREHQRILDRLNLQPPSLQVHTRLERTNTNTSNNESDDEEYVTADEDFEEEEYKILEDIRRCPEAVNKIAKQQFDGEFLEGRKGSIYLKIKLPWIKLPKLCRMMHNGELQQLLTKALISDDIAKGRPLVINILDISFSLPKDLYDEIMSLRFDDEDCATDFTVDHSGNPSDNSVKQGVIGSTESHRDELEFDLIETSHCVPDFVPHQILSKTETSDGSCTDEQEHDIHVPLRRSGSVSSETSIDGCYPVLRGLAVIINNKNFHDGSIRRGSDVDRNRFVTELQELGFAIHVYEDLSAKEIEQCFNHYKSINHSRFSCFVACVMSHGQLGTIHGVDGKAVPIIDLTSLLTSKRCPTLKGKPKAFFVVGCQGSEEDVTTTTGHTNNMVKENTAGGNSSIMYNHILAPKLEEDFFISYSTLPGQVSYRFSKTGSPFIRFLCLNLRKYGKTRDIAEIVAKTVKHLSRNPVKDGNKLYHLSCSQFSSLKDKFIIAPTEDATVFVEEIPRYHPEIMSLRFDDEDCATGFTVDQTGNPSDNSVKQERTSSVKKLREPVGLWDILYTLIILFVYATVSSTAGTHRVVTSLESFKNGEYFEFGLLIPNCTDSHFTLCKPFEECEEYSYIWNSASQCVLGGKSAFHKSKDDPFCTPHTRCGIGYGVTKLGLSPPELRKSLLEEDNIIAVDWSTIQCEKKNDSIVYYEIWFCEVQPDNNDICQTGTEKHEMANGNETQHIISKDIKADSQYLVWAVSVTDSGKSRESNKINVVSSGYSEWEIALIAVAAVIGLTFVCCGIFFVFRKWGKEIHQFCTKDYLMTMPPKDRELGHVNYNNTDYYHPLSGDSSQTTSGVQRKNENEKNLQKLENENGSQRNSLIDSGKGKNWDIRPQRKGTRGLFKICS